MNELRSRYAEIGLKLVYAFAAMFCVAILIVLFSAVSCINEGKTRATLEANNYTNIKLTGYDPWSCSDDDSTCTGFEATAPNGQPVKGAVGCGYFYKGCTIRLK